MKLKGFKKAIAAVLMLVMAVGLLPSFGHFTSEAATEYVRIKNVWQQTYLYQSGDRVNYGNTAKDNEYSHWELINISDGAVKIRNRATGDYMHIENLKGYIQCSSINNDWHSARWLKSDAGNGQYRFNNYWQRGQYWHIENLRGNVQSGSIYDAWSSAKWELEKVAQGETQAPTKAPETQAPTKAPETEAQGNQGSAESVTTSYKANDRSHCRVGGGATQGNSIENLHIGGAYGEFYNIDGGNGGSAEITLHYATVDGSPKIALYVNGNRTSTIQLSSTGGWGNYTGTYKFSANLNAGNNTIKFLHDDFGINISSIDVKVNKTSEQTPTKAPETQAPTKAPETQAPTKAPETQAPTKAPETQAPAEYGNPDLIVSEIICEPANPTAGTPVTFKAKITNQGTASTKAGIITGVRFSVDSLNAGTYTWSDTDTSSIAPGQSVIVTANGGSAGSTWNAANGTHTIYAWVDDVNRIAESNENNNTNTKTVNVSAASSGGNTGGSTVPDSGSDKDGRVIGYNVPSGKATSSNVSMKANGVSVGVFDTTVNNSHTWVGYYPPLSSARVAIFDFDGTANVTLTVNYYVGSATIRPLADGVTPTITHNGNTSYISFKIKQAGQYSVELNGNLTDAVMIFASKIEAAPSGNVIKVSSGQARYENITVGNGQTLYIEGGAAVYGRVFCQSGSTVAGRGIIDQSHMGTWGGSNGQYPMSIEFANNVHVNGVSVLNSSCWNYQIYNSNHVYLDNIKIVSARPNGDGISIQSSDNVHVTNSFIRTWDDGVVLKNYSSNNTHDVYVENCRFWTDLAQSMEIGFETNAGYGGTCANPSIYAVKFNNITVMHALHKAPISIHNGDNAEIHDITWSNITIEDCNVGQGDGWHLWLDFTNVPAGNIPGAYGGWTHQGARGTIHDITLKNINVLSSSTTDYRIWANGNGDIYNIYAENAYTYR